MSSVLFPEPVSSPQFLTGDTRPFHWQNWKSFPPVPPVRSSLSPRHSVLLFSDAMLWLQQNICSDFWGSQQNTCSKYLGVSSLPYSFFFVLFLSDCMKQSPKRLSESPGFAWCCRKIESHLKNSISSSSSIPRLFKSFILMVSNLIPWLNLLVASLCLFSLLWNPSFASGAEVPPNFTCRRHFPP